MHAITPCAALDHSHHTRAVRVSIALLLATLVTMLSAHLARAQQTQQDQQNSGRVHDFENLQWRAMGPLMEQAVVDGSPMAEGEFAIAIRFKPGGLIQPHWHPKETRVTVIRGDVWVGFGDEADTTHTKTIGAGSYAIVPAEAHHYEGARTDALIIISGPGPLKTTMVKAATSHP
ncbi:MAG TPA: cupin domain-containing protein [Gemmatimonadaceae bacterium]